MEPLGSEVFLDVKIGEASLIARTGPDTRAKPHGKLFLKPNPVNMRFFDIRDEKAIH